MQMLQQQQQQAPPAAVPQQSQSGGQPDKPEEGRLVRVGNMLQIVPDEKSEKQVRDLQAL